MDIHIGWLVRSDDDVIPQTIVLPVVACVIALVVVCFIVVICRHCYVTKMSIADDVTSTSCCRCESKSCRIVTKT